jgi:Transposase DDE domain
MATSGRGSGIVGYNVQVAVDTKHHLIIAHEVTNSGSDRGSLPTSLLRQSKSSALMNSKPIADRGYYSRCRSWAVFLGYSA